MTMVPYRHQMAAHCESGTVATMLNNAGMAITEPMIFGIGSGIFFGYFHRQRSFPFPTFIVRNRPGQIRKNIEKRLGVRFQTFSFRDSESGMKALDDELERGQAVANQVDFFYMEYLPSWERVHMNVHFMVVVGKEDHHYLVSDSYFPKVARLPEESLRKARFAGGSMSPRGFMFYPAVIPTGIDYEKAVITGIRKACFNMLKIPVPFLGVKGIRQFARKLPEWPGMARDTEHLSHEVMKINILLEDQGTGGGGFRFMYATFLQQAGTLLGRPEFLELSRNMMQIGDGWREISLLAARIGKNRDLGPDRLKDLSELLLARADAEEKFFKDLRKTV
jgi:hypothetical protein